MFTDRERYVYQVRVAPSGRRPSCAEVAKRIGVSRQRIQQIETNVRIKVARRNPFGSAVHAMLDSILRAPRDVRARRPRITVAHPHAEPVGYTDAPERLRVVHESLDRIIARYSQ